jgi:hypothetical protein
MNIKDYLNESDIEIKLAKYPKKEKINIEDPSFTYSPTTRRMTELETEGHTVIRKTDGNLFANMMLKVMNSRNLDLAELAVEIKKELSGNYLFDKQTLLKEKYRKAYVSAWFKWKSGDGGKRMQELKRLYFKAKRELIKSGEL